MSSVLILHHLEPLWEVGYRQYYTTFEEQCVKAVRAIDRLQPCEVWLTRFEDHRLDSIYPLELARRVTEVFEYGYNWPRLCVEEAPNDFIPVVKDFGIQCATWIAPWMRRLKDYHKVWYGGAFAGECLEDLRVAFCHLEIPARPVKSIIVGNPIRHTNKTLKRYQ